VELDASYFPFGNEHIIKSACSIQFSELQPVLLRKIKQAEGPLYLKFTLAKIMSVCHSS